MPPSASLKSYSTEFQKELDVLKPIGISRLIELTDRLIDFLPIKSVKLTGGEPLLSQYLFPLIEFLKTKKIDDISLTSNGVHLAEISSKLKLSGLRSINVSLDAANNETFRKITGKSYFEKVVKGIEVAKIEGFELKINSVIMKNINDAEIIPLLNLANKLGISIRFLEVMEMGPLYGKIQDILFSQDEILEIISNNEKITPVIREYASTANYWTTESGGRFGIIANHTFPFCGDCNRIRLDSYGKIYGCITDETGISTENVKFTDDLSDLLSEALARKQEKRFKGSTKTMISFGG